MICRKNYTRSIDHPNQPTLYGHARNNSKCTLRATIDESEVLNMINLRNTARKNKDYKEADRIRDQLLDKGVLIEDKDDKTLWKFK